MYRKILQEPLTFPSSDVVPPAARDLLTRLLDRDPQRRLGANGAAEIKSHHFFTNIDWRKLLQRKYEPSFRPNVVCYKTLVPSMILCLSGAMALTGSFRSWTLVTRQTSIANSRKRPLRTPTWRDQSCLKPCSNSSRAGLTTGRLQVWEMPVAVSRIRPSEAFPSRAASCIALVSFLLPETQWFRNSQFKPIFFRVKHLLLHFLLRSPNLLFLFFPPPLFLLS